MLIDNTEHQLREKQNIINYDNNILQIKLKGINITYMSYLVNECESFSSLFCISKKNIKIVSDIRCSSLSS